MIATCHQAGLLRRRQPGLVDYSRAGHQWDYEGPAPRLDPARESDFTSDKAALYRLVDGLTAGGNTPLYDFTPDAVMDYIASRKQEPKYIGHPVSKVSHEPMSPFTLTWLRKKRHTCANVLKYLLRPKLPKLVIEPLTEAEIRRAFAAMDTRTTYGARNYAILLLFLDTGLRCGELCGLKLEDVHLEGKHCYVKVLGKGQKERIEYVGRWTHEALLTTARLCVHDTPRT